MDYITAKETAELWGLTTRRVQILCEQGKIQGAARLGKVWAIPKYTPKPPDGRYKENRKKTNSDSSNAI